MRIARDVETILARARKGYDLTRGEALRLMRVPLDSLEMHLLCGVADEMTRRACDGQGDVFGQIGLNYERCSAGCTFCLFGLRELTDEERVVLSVEDVVERARRCEREGANGIYLMATGNYSVRQFLRVGRAVRAAISPELPLVANIGDLGQGVAEKLVQAGFNAIYHSVRLREGVDTRLTVGRRLATIRRARQAGLAVHFCVEPAGPEHSDQELVDLMFLGREIGAVWSGAMRRVNVPGSPLEAHGELSWWALARVVAVCRLVMGRASHAHCTHEPNLAALLAGANILWAEVGPNPRDQTAETERGRGMSVADCRQMLLEAGYTPREGPTPNVWPPQHHSVKVYV